MQHDKFLIINQLDLSFSQIYFGMFADSLLASCQHTCMMYTIAVRTVKNS